MNTLILIASMIMLAPSADAAVAWKTVLDKGYVKGYSRPVPGTDIHEFRSTAVIPAGIEIIGAVLRNVEGLKHSSSHCTDVRFVEYINKNNYTFYVSYSYPPPVADRDVIVRVITRYDLERGRTITELVAVKEAIVPRRKGVIRITDYRSQIVLEYINRDRTGIVLTSRLDPGGSIPAFIVNYISKRALDEGAKDLMESVRKRKYRDAAERYGDVAIVEREIRGGIGLKKIYANRMREFISDNEFVSMLIEDDAVCRRLIEGRTKASESIVHGWGSLESKREAVRDLITMYLRLKGVPEDRVRLIVDDRSLIPSIINNGGGCKRIKNLLKK